MTAPRPSPGTGIPPSLIRTIAGRLAENKRVRRTLPDRGRVHIDRPLPFLCMYRFPPRRVDTGTARFVTGEASYLIASGDPGMRRSLSTLLATVAETLGRAFGSFLLVEIWADGSALPADGTEDPARPAFTIVTPTLAPDTATIRVLRRALAEVDVLGRSARVEVDHGARCAPPGLKPALSATVARDRRCHLVGIAVRPIHYDARTGQEFPLVRRALHRGLAHALKRALFRFAWTNTTLRPPHFHALGRHAVVKAVWEIDRRLADVSSAFDFLLEVTPVNVGRAWSEFKRSRFSRTPVFAYRPRSVDPALLKRALHNVRIERLEDPTLAVLFREKRDELDRQLTMLDDRDTLRFLYGSLQLFGAVDDALLRAARQVLRRVPSPQREGGRGPYLDARALAGRAEAEVAAYRDQDASASMRVEIRSDLGEGLMVSKGRLLIGKETRVPRHRAEALLQHEVGTHWLTYHNGRAQPFRQLCTGLPGYEELQEGLAVLAEYLVGGLTRPRLRLLAARVVAARHVVEGASFVETFRELHEEFGLAQRAAFTVAMRVHRGGGFTKDAVYLRGLLRLLDHLGRGGKLEPLYIGKIAAEHVPIIEELQWRNVLKTPPLRPRFLADPSATQRLAKLRKGVSLLGLVEGRTT